MDGLKRLSYCVKSDRETNDVIPYMRNLKRNDMNELIYKTEIDSQT